MDNQALWQHKMDSSNERKEDPWPKTSTRFKSSVTQDCSCKFLPRSNNCKSKARNSHRYCTRTPLRSTNLFIKWITAKIRYLSSIGTPNRSELWSTVQNKDYSIKFSPRPVTMYGNASLQRSSPTLLSPKYRDYQMRW